MNECFRNTRAIIEPAFNVLYGTCAPAGSPTPAKDYGDLSALEQKGLIQREGEMWRVRFARREGQPLASRCAQAVIKRKMPSFRDSAGWSKRRTCGRRTLSC